MAERHQPADSRPPHGTPPAFRGQQEQGCRMADMNGLPQAKAPIGPKGRQAIRVRRIPARVVSRGGMILERMASEGWLWKSASNAAADSHDRTATIEQVKIERMKIEQVKWRLLLPGASEPRLTGLNPSGLEIGLSNCVTQPEQPEHSCRLQLLKSPITAEQYREKASPLRPRRSCFAPAETRHHGKSGFGGGAGCCPRVRMVYCGGHLFP